MADLSVEEVKAIAKAVGVQIEEPHLSEVMHSLNALKEVLDPLSPPGLEQVESLPVIYPSGGSSDE